MGSGLPVGGEWLGSTFSKLFSRGQTVLYRIRHLHRAQKIVVFQGVSLEGVRPPTFEESLLKACLAFQAVFSNFIDEIQENSHIQFCFVLLPYVYFPFSKSGIKNIIYSLGGLSLLKLSSFKCSDCFNIWVFDIVQKS